MQEILDQIKFALTLKIKKEFFHDPFRFITSQEGHILVEKKIGDTQWYEHLSNVKFEDLPTFCESNAGEDTKGSFRSLLSNLNGATIRSNSQDSWTVRPSGSK